MIKLPDLLVGRPPAFARKKESAVRMSEELGHLLGTCCVTGASGFIGRVLVARLKSHGCRVRALVRGRPEGLWDEARTVDFGSAPISSDVLDNVDSVFHLAARVHAAGSSADAEADYQRIDVAGTRRLLELSRQAAVRRFVFFSSVKAMGEEHRGCLDETAPPCPVTAYGKSKLGSERLVLEGGYVPHPCVLRLSMVYGPGGKGNLPRMVRAVKKGWFPPLSGVVNERSMVHVEDAVEAAMLAATQPRAAGQVYLVTDGTIYATGEIYAAIRSALGLKPRRWSVPMWMMAVAARTGDVGERILRRPLVFNSEAFRKLAGSECYDSGKIREELGFRARHSFLATLPETVAAQVENGGTAR